MWTDEKVKQTFLQHLYRRRTPAIGFHFDLMSHHSYVIANVVSK